MNLAGFLLLATILSMLLTQIVRQKAKPRMYSKSSVPLAFIIWLIVAILVLRLLPVARAYDATGFVLIGITECIWAMIASAYCIMCVVNNK